MSRAHKCIVNCRLMQHRTRCETYIYTKRCGERIADVYISPSEKEQNFPGERVKMIIDDTLSLLGEKKIVIHFFTLNKKLLFF